MVEQVIVDADVAGTDDIAAGSAMTAISSVAGANGVPVLPMPARLEQPRTTRSLMSAVRGYFYTAYNTNPRFKRYLASVGNSDSQTKNRMFDRHVATTIIQDLAGNAKDRMTAEAPPGHVYQCLVAIMHSEKLGLKLRRQQYHQLTHQAQAAE